MERKRYLRRLDLETAKEIWEKALQGKGWLERRKKEKVPVISALKRLLAEPVFAKRSVPNYISSAMDGIAVKSEKTIFASEKNPIRLKKGDFYWINTGEILKEGYDSVIMAEFVREISEDEVEIYKPSAPYENVRLLGEDCEFGEMIFTSNKILEPIDLSFLLSSGVDEVWVYSKPKVLVIPTGDELVRKKEDLREGKVLETNSIFIENYLKLLGAEVEIEDILPDDPKVIEDKLISIKNFDLVITIGGSSAGSKDYIAKILEKNGELLVHGVNVRPGKPLILGFINDIPLIGLPGYPQACFNDFSLFVVPYISSWTGIKIEREEKILANLALRIVNSPSEKHIIPGVLGKVNEKFWFYPLKSSSSVISSLVKKDGRLIISKGVEGINEKDVIEVLLDKDIKEVEKNIIFVGSHDLLMDLLAEFIKEKMGKNLIIFPLGSMMGLDILYDKRAHFTGIHLLDEETGEYNTSFLKKFSPREYLLINLSYRQQGFLVKKGNPKNIKNLRDLEREDIRFVNRQKGSGTRILLDFLLKKEGINKEKIKGYSDIEYTHLGIGAKVYYGFADVGLGIQAVADAFGLDFIPISEERYDLLFPKEFLEDHKEILSILRSKEFLKKAKEIKGYDLRDLGKEFAWG
ncbi:MAG: molybdopterin biosynthesis protein [Dictyoglomaceae bacterium]